MQSTVSPHHHARSPLPFRSAQVQSCRAISAPCPEWGLLGQALSACPGFLKSMRVHYAFGQVPIMTAGGHWSDFKSWKTQRVTQLGIPLWGLRTCHVGLTHKQALRYGLRRARNLLHKQFNELCHPMRFVLLPWATHCERAQGKTVHKAPAPHGQQESPPLGTNLASDRSSNLCLGPAGRDSTGSITGCNELKVRSHAGSGRG